MSYYKVVIGRKACHGGTYTYRIGSWTKPVEGELVSCKNGYHICTEEQLMAWMYSADTVLEVEAEDVIDNGDKCVARRIKPVRVAMDRRAYFDFRADIAEHVLHIFEDRFPGDERPRKAIEATRKCGRSKTAASVAHAHAAYAASAYAYTDSVYGASYAAYAAASDSAYGAAKAAKAAKAVYAAANAERRWQRDLLHRYLTGGES